MFSVADHSENPVPSILVVDDDADSRWLVTRILHRQGYLVDNARNGEEAFLKLILFLRPSLILLDLDMPVMDGKTFRRIQMAYDRFASIPVVLRSAHLQLDSIAQELKVAGTCRKGQPLPQLLAIIDKILKSKGT